MSITTVDSATTVSPGHPYERHNMKIKAVSSAVVALVLASGGMLLGAAPASAATVGVVGTIVAATPESNSPGWWTDEGEHPSECYKHELGANEHGSTTDGDLTVTLNAFNQDWPGDHWELLAIKAGNEVNVIQHPEAGVAYASPNNPAGNQATVSHWIVCKGTTPEPEPDVAKADYGLTGATCTSGQTVTIGDNNLVNATWTAESLAKNGTAGPAEFDITAVLNDGAVWADGQTGTFHVVLLGPDTSLCPTVSECEAYSSVHTTNLATWDRSSTSTDGSGHNRLAPTSVHVWTDATGHRKAAAYYATDFALADMGEFVLNWAGASTAPGGQAVIDLNNDGTPDGTLVIESIYGGIQWLSVPAGGTWVVRADSPHVSGGGGYPNQGTFNDWLALNPDARIKAIGWSLGSGVTSDGNITQITAGCVNYTFGLPVLPEQQSGNDVTTEVDCATEEFVTFTTAWTINFSRDADDQPVAGPKQYLAPVEERRAATIEELDTAECPLPEEPEPFNETITNRDVDCEADTITVTSQTKFHTWLLVDREWVEVVETGAPVVVVLDADDTACPPTVVTETPPTDTLAFTGSTGVNPVVGGGVLALIAAGIFAVSLASRKRRIQ